MLLVRRHGWQRPLHPLQIIGISVFCFLVISFYCFLGIFLGNKIAEITVNAVFSFSAFSVALLFIRCSATDPSDKTRFRFRKKKKNSKSSNGTFNSGFSYGYIFSRILIRFFRRIERKILRIFIRRKYTLDQMEPLIIPFPLILMDNDPSLSLTPAPTKQDDISFCSLCDFEVNKYSKHCRTCDRCVEGFDHHCRWLNNCVGKKNYTTFILLMVFVLIMLTVQGGTAIAVFVRCFADIKGIEHDLIRNHYANFPRGLLAAISILLFLVVAYSTVALGQLFFFHVVLIRKGISTYDYILAMKEENLSMELESLEDSDFSSDESDDFESPERPSGLMSRIICREGKHKNPQKLVIKIDRESPDSPLANRKQQQGFRASIDPWKLINLSREKALLAAEKAREKLASRHMQQLGGESDDQLKPLPQETKSGLSLVKSDTEIGSNGVVLVSPVISKGKGLTSSGQFSSPRRRLSGSSIQHGIMSSSPKHNTYKRDFDLKLTKVSREMETYISRQVLCSVLKNDGGCETSPRF